MRSYFAAMALILLFGPATAQPLFDVRALSPTGVEEAKADVASMKRNELRSLLIYFSECEDRLRPQTPSCKSAIARYRIEFGRDRPVDATIQAIEKISEIRGIVRAQGIAPNGDGAVEAAEDALRKAVGQALRSQE